MKKPYNYKLLIENFLNNIIAVKEFENSYWENFKNEDADLSENLFHILDKLFAEVDMYTDNEEYVQQDPVWNINEKQLRVYAQEALDEIEKLEGSFF